MYNNWVNRSEISSNLFNPAFLSEVIRIYGKEYVSISNSSGFQFESLAIAMPLILDKRIRESLPKTKSTKFHQWIQENGPILVDFHSKAQAILPFLREAIVFSVNHEVIDISDKGEFTVVRLRKPRYWHGMLDETVDIFKAAKFVGKWNRTFPSKRIVFALLGVKP